MQLSILSRLRLARLIRLGFAVLVWCVAGLDNARADCSWTPSGTTYLKATTGCFIGIGDFTTGTPSYLLHVKGTGSTNPTYLSYTEGPGGANKVGINDTNSAGHLFAFNNGGTGIGGVGNFSIDDMTSPAKNLMIFNGGTGNASVGWTAAPAFLGSVSPAYARVLEVSTANNATAGIAALNIQGYQTADATVGDISFTNSVLGGDLPPSSGPVNMTLPRPSGC